jgi:AcrR family transcriptional regulator
MRAIAKELGATTGVVTHYFRDKEALILFALKRVFEHVLVDMQAAAQGRNGLEGLEQMICTALPLEMSDKDDWKVWVAFWDIRSGANI